jgi:two-component system response regulator HydG
LGLVKEHILPVSGGLPVVAGVQAGDPRHPVADLFAEYARLGVSGITNWPAVGFLDGALRHALMREGRTVERELAMLIEARRAGFAAFGFVFTPEEARAFAAAGLEALIFHMGLTRQADDVHAMRDQLQLNQSRLNAMLEAAQAGAASRAPAGSGATGPRASALRPRCLAFGGTLTEPDDLAELLRHCPLDGFAGGSVFERLPVGGILDSTVRRFKSVLLRPPDRAAAGGMGAMLGRSPRMQELFGLIRRVAPFDVNVCIEGESGSGKELVAVHLHKLNRRANQPFVTLNCGAIPDTLLESELFGHEKGAFTGADRRRLGKFELAQGGTLFLDEIADLSPHGQVALLRAIQQREITRVGGDRPIPIDVRIVAASNQSLLRLSEQGRFRPDLYHRLNNVTLHVPALRDRLADLPLLIEDILARQQVQLGRRISGVSPRFLAKLHRHAWPGNVRELQHALAQAALLEENLVLEGIHFQPIPAGLPAAGGGHAASPAGGPRTWEPAPGVPDPRFRAPVRDDFPRAPAHADHAVAWEEWRQPFPRDPRGAGLRRGVHPEMGATRRERAERAVAECDGNKSRAAAALGVTRKTLYAWLGEPAPGSREGLAA